MKQNFIKLITLVGFCGRFKLIIAITLDAWIFGLIYIDY